MADAATSPGPGINPGVDADLAEAALASARQVSLKSLMLGNGPRFARDAFGPLLTFYILWKAWGLLPGIAGATVVSLLAYRYERRRDRSGTMARLSLGFVFIQAVVGLAAGSATAYLAQPVLLNGAFGIAFLVSAAIGKPLAAVFAKEFYPFPKEVRESRTFRRIFATISVAWGVYNCLRSALRLLTLASAGVEAFLVVNLVTGVPITMALMTWSIWYAVRGFRGSDEWGWAMRGEAPPPGMVAQAQAVAPAQAAAVAQRA